MKKIAKTLYHDYLVVAVYLVLVFLLFRYAAGAQRENTQLSLRYTDVPIASSQAAAAQFQLGDPDESYDFIAAFWAQQQSVALSTDFGSATASVVYVDGEMKGVYPVTFLYGSYPTSIDKQSIVVSEGLAWKLWGASNLMGVEFEWEGKTYLVRGVFEGVEPMMLVQVDSEQFPELTYTGVDLYGTPNGDPRTAALDFAGKIGLGTPNSVVSGESIAGLLMALALIPAAMLVIWFIAKLLGQLHRIAFWKRQLVWFVFLLVLALAIPRLLDMLPAWVVPNKWSDLDAWSGFYEEMSTRINEWLSLYPSFRDVELKKQLIRQVVLAVPCMFAISWGIHIWNRKLTWLAQKPQRADVAVEDGLQDEEGGQDTTQEDMPPPEHADDILSLLEDASSMKPGEDDPLR